MQCVKRSLYMGRILLRFGGGGHCNGWFIDIVLDRRLLILILLMVSLDPFFCVGCSQASYNKELVDLRNTVNSL